MNFQKILPELVVTSGAYTLILRPGMDLTLSITVCWQTVLPESASATFFGSLWDPGRTGKSAKPGNIKYVLSVVSIDSFVFHGLS